MLECYLKGLGDLKIRQSIDKFNKGMAELEVEINHY